MNQEPKSADRTVVARREAALSISRDAHGFNAWNVAVLAATVIVAAGTPVEIVFHPLNAAWVLALSLVTSLLFAVDIRRRFSRPIVVAGRPVLDPAIIRRTYLRGWFVIDLLAAIPFDVISELPGISGTGAADVIRIVGLLRVLRAARILVVQSEWRLRTSFNPALMRLAFFAFWVFLLSHWIACGWISLGGASSGHPELPAYQQGLYWTITTLTTVGFGDITPVGVRQVLYAMVVMGLGAAMYGYIIGNVASLLANIDVMRARHLGRMETINNFMRDRHVPRELQAKVRDYYNYMWESRMGDQADLLQDLPNSLHVDIALHLNRNILRKVPIFERASELFLRELVLHLVPMVFLPGQPLMRRGEAGNRVYFINRGTVEVLSADDSEVVATLSDGDFVGEWALLSSQPRANTVTAIDYCNVYALERAKFNQVLEDFPEFAAEVRRIADERRAESGPGA